MMKPEDRIRLLNSLTEYDRGQSKRKGYNRYALGHYMRGLDHVVRHVDAGHSIRDAIITEFTGRLCDRLLKTLGLPTMSDSEARYGLANRLPVIDD